MRLWGGLLVSSVSVRPSGTLRALPPTCVHLKSKFTNCAALLREESVTVAILSPATWGQYELAANTIRTAATQTPSRAHTHSIAAALQGARRYSHLLPTTLSAEDEVLVRAADGKDMTIRTNERALLNRNLC